MLSSTAPASVSSISSSHAVSTYLSRGHGIARICTERLVCWVLVGQKLPASRYCAMAPRLDVNGFQLPVLPAATRGLEDPEEGSSLRWAATGGVGGLLSAEQWLLVASTVEFLGLSVSLQASSEVWLRYYAGDLGGQARMMGLLSAAGSGIGFLLKPSLALLGDVIGRKPMLVMSYLIQALVKGAVALAPPQFSVPLLAVSQYLLGCVTWELSAQTIDACLGDVLSSDQARLGSVIANQQTYWQMVSIVGPLLGGAAARYGEATLPLGLTAATMAGVTLITLLFVPETLPPSKRSARFSLSATSPLAFVELFRNGAGLSCAVVMQTVSTAPRQPRIFEWSCSNTLEAELWWCDR